MVRRHPVQLVAIGPAALPHAVWLHVLAADPCAGRSARRALLDLGEEHLHRRRELRGQIELVQTIAELPHEDIVGVRVDEARGHRLAAPVDQPRAGADEALHVVIGAHPHDDPVPHGHGVGARVRRVHGQYGGTP